MKELEEYHHVWLVKHEKDIIWLRNALLNGFDIHHMDGDHSNNEPENLILIYCGDHALLHGQNIKKFSARSGGKWVTEEERNLLLEGCGGKVYQLRVKGLKWKFIVGRFDYSYPFLSKALKTYCSNNFLEFPHIRSKNKNKIKIKNKPRKIRLKKAISVKESFRVSKRFKCVKHYLKKKNLQIVKQKKERDSNKEWNIINEMRSRKIAWKFISKRLFMPIDKVKQIYKKYEK